MFSINCKGTLLSLGEPVVMGIINATPDSFVQGHLSGGIEGIIILARQMLADGAGILDVGGQSTRPGSKRISAAEETDRVLPVIEALSALPGAIISIDTYSSEVARAAVMAGACIVNDISSGKMDEAMLETVAALKVPYSCMHMQGRPENMQEHPHYEDVVQEVLDGLLQTIDRAARAGITDIIIDPGFGFGKTAAHNLRLLKNLQAFAVTGKPLLVGLSRKRTIAHILDTDAAGALNGTTVMNTIALMNGASLLRVHDVKEAREAVLLYGAYKKTPR